MAGPSGVATGRSGSPAGLGERVRARRTARGLTQAGLAAAAGVSRQLVGAVEAGRHLPRVDAAAAIAGVLDTSVEALLTDPVEPSPVGVLPGTVPDGLVRAARVGERRVVVPAPPTDAGLPVADGTLREGRLDLFDAEQPTVVVAGCEPALGLAARLVESRSTGRAIAVSTTSARAIEALADGRVHAGVVHGPVGALPTPPREVRRFRLARWQVGLAARTDLPTGWARTALTGGTQVVQREDGAQTQAAFERAVLATGAPGAPRPGPRAADHLDAARQAERRGLAAVTIEPTARLLGLAFHPLEVHTSELWIVAEHRHLPAVERYLAVLTDDAVTARLIAVGGYDLEELGWEVAA